MLENNALLTEEEIKIREEVKELANAVDPELLRKMDKDEVDYPFEFLKLTAERNILGLRFPEEYGGRGLNWMAETVAMEK